MKNISIVFTVQLLLFILFVGCSPGPVTNYFVKDNKPLQFEKDVKIVLKRPSAFWGGAAQVFVIDQYHPMPANSFIGFITSNDTPMEFKPNELHEPLFHYLDPSVDHKYKTIDRYGTFFWEVNDIDASDQDRKEYVLMNDPSHCVGSDQIAYSAVDSGVGAVIYTDTGVGKTYRRIYETDDDGPLTRKISYDALENWIGNQKMKVVGIDVILCRKETGDHHFALHRDVIKFDIRKLKMVGTLAAKEELHWFRPPGRSQIGILVSAFKEMWIKYFDPIEFQAGHQYNIELSLAPPATITVTAIPLDSGKVVEKQ